MKLSNTYLENTYVRAPLPTIFLFLTRHFYWTSPHFVHDTRLKFDAVETVKLVREHTHTTRSTVRIKEAEQVNILE